LKLWGWGVILLDMDTATTPSVTIRPAYPDDASALRRLAALDSAVVPAQPLLVAEIDGQLEVAVSTTDLTAIADPFVPTAHVVELVRGHIRRTDEADRPRRSLLSRLTPVPAPRVA
jgi:hypothetical protein